MPEITIPLSKGDARSTKNLDYIDKMPVNMLTVLREVDGSPGFLRFFPGIDKQSDVSGLSRGVHYNTVKEDCYRVLGNKLYFQGNQIGDVSGSGRVSMTHSRTSVAVSNGQINIFKYDGTTAQIENWPDEVTPGFTKVLATQISNSVGNSLLINAESARGEISITISPSDKSGNTGSELTINESTWSTPESQSQPPTGTPYIKNVRVEGIKSAGLTLYLKYDFIPNLDVISNPYDAAASTAVIVNVLRAFWGKADQSLQEVIEATEKIEAYFLNPGNATRPGLLEEWDRLNPANASAQETVDFVNANRRPEPTDDSSKIEWIQDVDDFTIEGTSYDWGKTSDVCRLRGRYIWLQEGEDTFWATSIEDETKIDRIDPASRAEYMPDDLRAIRAWKDFLVCFGGSTIEFFTLTGDANNLFRSSPGHTIEMGVAGRFAVTHFMGSFAFVTSDAHGIVTVSMMSSGQAVPVSSRTINQLLANYTTEQLSSIVLETLKYEHHELLICHFPDQTLVYDATSKVWSKIKTGLDDDPHRAIDYCKVGNVITCGDKLETVTGLVNMDSCAQYGEKQEIELYSPLITAPNAMLFDLEITPGTGVSSYATRLLVSATTDGVIYGPEKPVIINKPQQWLLRSIMRSVGRVRNRIGLKLRVVTDTPVTLDKLRVRSE